MKRVFRYLSFQKYGYPQNTVEIGKGEKISSENKELNQIKFAALNSVQTLRLRELTELTSK